LSDADDIFSNYAANSEVTRFLFWRPYKESSAVVPFLQSQIDRWESGDEYSWTITPREQDRVLGMIACRVREHAADIGYVIGRDFWNRGYMTEAARPVVHWAIGLPLVYRVWAVCDIDNKASARVLEKIGMQREGILRRYIIHPTMSAEPRNCLVYSIVR
jgi:RimJ/RimL family protein N-acetyltransferase